jgi:pilus assembly protein Flp/PilA
MRLLRNFLRCEQGATAIEYALIASFVSIVIVGSVTLVGSTLTGIFTSVSNGFK